MIPMIVLTLLVFVSWIFIKNNILRIILGCISTLLLLVLVIGISGNMSNHWGMEKKEVKSEPKQIYSATPPIVSKKTLIADKIAEESNSYIMLYKNNENDKKPRIHFKPNFKSDEQSEVIKKKANYTFDDTNKATVQTTSKYWVWKSDFYKFLFAFGDDKKELITQDTQVTLPKDSWHVISSKEAKSLNK
ncbi:DUF4811 domain-containing protein [Staphylococcus saprophyticus]|uniref:DUF4811 domain-containing protein n=1 Tax=Staphylococcus saprophyticus TaxID=29385 RepID=UPI00188961F3|nr:DUF4811 domain-containing protein [Staphylococcus saprophyticus]MBF2782793.1 DUF4811 domain-containing protein [Staphylococcus saprophyticus]